MPKGSIPGFGNKGGRNKGGQAFLIVVINKGGQAFLIVVIGKSGGQGKGEGALLSLIKVPDNYTARFWSLPS